MNLQRATLNVGRLPSPSRERDGPNPTMFEALARTASQVLQLLIGSKTASLRAQAEEDTVMNSPCL